MRRAAPRGTRSVDVVAATPGFLREHAGPQSTGVWMPGTPWLIPGISRRIVFHVRRNRAISRWNRAKTVQFASLSDGSSWDSVGFRRVLMGFSRVLYSFRRDPYNNPAVFINTREFPSDVHACPTDVHACPSEIMEKHATISGIHMDPQDCWVERLGSPSGFQQRSWSTPGLDTFCAGHRVETARCSAGVRVLRANPLHRTVALPD